VVPAPEIYDPATGTFGPAGGDTVIPLVFASATLLQDGKVLLAGGQTATLPGPGATPDPDDSNGTPTGEAELFDPATGTFSATGSMSMPRIFHTATLLPDGRVLIVGGTVDLDLGGTSDTPDPTMQTAELYDPATGTFTATGSPGMPRIGHAAALLSDGRVLITGGTAPGASGSGSLTRAAEIYDPATGTFSPTGDMVTGHVFHSATTLPDGHVLIAGLDEAAMSGLSGGTPDLLASAELYDPATGTFTTVEVEPAIMPSPAPTEG
jgi:hypothetical protein